MTEITLKDCKNCYSLPLLGQLPSLKKLVIRGFGKMLSLETQFYNSNESAFETPFPSLEYLSFSNMPEWQEWCLFEMGAFPQLQQLSLDNCPKLEGYLPKHLPALKILKINNCQRLTSCIPKAGLLDSIEISRSEGVVLRAEEGAISVKSLEISGSEKPEFPNQVSRESLKSLKIFESCDSLCSFPIDAFPNLERLHFWRCENLERIVVSQSVAQNMQSITLSSGLPALNMTYLDIHDCPNFKSLPPHMDKLLPNLNDLSLIGCLGIEWQGEGDMPPHLTDLTIAPCVFTKFSKEWSLPNLSDLTIDGKYDNVQRFPTQGLLLPSSITSLWIRDCETLETLDCNGFLLLTSLKDLVISSCPKLEKIAGERLPSSIERLCMWRCPLLEEQCRMKNAVIWPKMPHIQTIEYL